MTRKQFLGLSVLGLASFSGVAGIVNELQSHAATPDAATEPELGTLTSGASVVTDPAASGGKAVTFIKPLAVTARNWKAGSFGGGDSSYRTAWQSSFGFSTQVWTVFEDFQNDWSDKASSIAAKAGEWFTNGTSLNIITLGLILSGTGSSSQTPNMTALKAAASGTDPAYVPGMQAVAQAIKDTGLNAATTVIRLGHEANGGNWYPWGTKSSDAATLASNQAAYRGAWAKAVPAIKAICPEVLFELCYNVGQGQLAEHYPGDQYVDILSMDFYDSSTTPATTTSQFVANQGGSGFAEIGALASQHLKKLAVSEWGVATDNPFFVHAMYNELVALTNQYPGIVHHDSYEDDSNSSHAFSKNPNTKAAYADIWHVTS